ncbi:tetraspanin-18-like [Mercenaria mercenaria]|uniref:tetraspanin-18-like n=1 Tax=Mercenaria mercenaria TaxID=6596 RepID=UPI00234E8B85|nr:tetraspanin-18-like [Mercenaria mercenaria]
MVSGQPIEPSEMPDITPGFNTENCKAKVIDFCVTVLKIPEAKRGVRKYSQLGKIAVLGDVNARCGNKSDFVQRSSHYDKFIPVIDKNCDSDGISFDNIPHRFSMDPIVNTSGGGLSGVGVWMMTDPKIETYFDILNVDQSSSSFKMICYALLAVGVFALLVAFLGCCGAVQKSKCLLTLFLILVGVITVMEAGLGVMVVVSKDSASAIPVLSALMSDMQDKLRTQLKQSVTEHYLPDTLLGTTWDNVQIELECCGATGPEDYRYSRWKNETRPETDYPDTCCVLMSKEAAVPEPSNKLLCHFGTAGFYFETGCYDKMIGWFQDNSMYIIASAGAVFVIEVVGFVSAFIICKNGIKKKSEESKQQSAKPAER